MSPLANEPARITVERGAELFELSKRWGRWGSDDERGALNLLTPERAQRAASLVRSGEVVACGRELAVQPAADNPNPALHHMTLAGDMVRAGSNLQASLDFVGVAFHGMAVSHIDALCHVFVAGEMYNGFPASDVRSVGARRGSIGVAFGGIVGRGILLDIPRLRGVPWLEPATEILPAELDAACAAHHVTPESGDIMLIATGRDARRAEHGPWSPNDPGLAGLHPECIPWLIERDPAVLGADGVSDVLPGNPHEWSMPVHQCLLVGMGVHLLDNLRLDRLAAACAAANRWEFLFTVAPLQIGGGTGSPVNPLAVL
jgi:kynurenine formamidase